MSFIFTCIIGGGVANLLVANVTPSIIAKIKAPKQADLVAAPIPPLAANTPPVKKPLAIKFHGSSFCLIPFNAQSNIENNLPHTAKLPPNTGERAFTAVIEPIIRSSFGEFFAPLTKCHMPHSWQKCLQYHLILPMGKDHD